MILKRLLMYQSKGMIMKQYLTIPHLRENRKTTKWTKKKPDLPGQGDERSSEPQGHSLRVIIARFRAQPGFRMRVLHTICCVWMFITLGWLVGIVGATFPDLRLIMDKNIETASWIFTVGSLGYLLGSFAFGLLFDRFNRLLMLSTVTSLSAVAIAVMPWCSQFSLMLAINFVSGFFTGGIDVSGNSHIASIWGRDAAPFMQTLHFGFSAGGMIGPQTAKPFSAQKSCSQLNTTGTTSTILPFTNSTTSCDEQYGETHIHYAYLITGIGSISATIPFLVLYCLSKRYNTYVNTPLLTTEKQEQQNTLPVLDMRKQIVFVGLLMTFISMYACVENRFSSLITTFTDEYLHWNKYEGLDLATVFWAAFAAGRFCSIPVTFFLKTSNMILIYLLFLTAVVIALLIASVYDIRQLIWACTACAGLSMSAIFPATFTWTAESILTVTGKISATYIVGVSVFNMIFPLLYGFVMDNYSQMYFVYLLLGQLVLSLLLYVAIRMLIRIYIKPFTPRKVSA
ncbi:sodium-dependent glucose transporter 1-like isoform X2 [Dreissena polymorpha]|uniref:sodium-dependent glucose transporter 1-like isoform X2 n=1 Tax=Dreissena polymorpha TaxID=45954 RepID=UPI0022655769|nr:sodium-dependent glucose transporter 1-like isoform X2 [Dreissena polymorpha]